MVGILFVITNTQKSQIAFYFSFSFPRGRWKKWPKMTDSRRNEGPSPLRRPIITKPSCHLTLFFPKYVGLNASNSYNFVFVK